MSGFLGRRWAMLAACVLVGLVAFGARSSAALAASGIEAPLPANAASSAQTARVASVSCASAGNCAAVGPYLDSSGAQQGLLLTESSGVWGTGVEASLPANAGSSPEVRLLAVSCPAAGDCVAVGTYLDSAGATWGLVLTETAGVWAAGVEAPLPANAKAAPNVYLASVSCASVGECAAVGSYDTSGNIEGLLLTETAGVWSADEAQLPVNAITTSQDVGLASVSCPSAGDCTAVGSYRDGLNSSQGLMVSETAGRWGTGVEAALPAGAASSYQQVDLGSVSCPSAGDCTAVGNYHDAAANPEGLLLSETSGAWATGVEAVLPANSGGSPFVVPESVSCTSTGNCIAVGYYAVSGNFYALVLTQSAGTWATGINPALPANAGASTANLLLVSCASAGDCTAVGNYLDSSKNVQGLLLSENSGVWGVGAEAPLPANTASSSPGGATVAYPLSVSCPSPDACTAVGFYRDNSGNTQGLLLDGRSGDSTPPSLSLGHAPDGQSGWNVSSPVTATLTIKDSDGDLVAASVACTVDGSAATLTPAGSATWTFPVSGDGSHSVSCQASDSDGNHGTASDTVKIDTIAPTISTSHSADGQNGWNVSSPATETVRAADGGSGLASGSPACTVDGTPASLTSSGSGIWTFIVSGDGTHSVSCQASDTAGNHAGSTDTVKIDTVPPTLAPSFSPDPVLPFDPASASPNASDGTSGVASSSCDPVSTATPGVHTVNCTATDNAGNTASATVDYTVAIPASTPGCRINGSGALAAGSGIWSGFEIDTDQHESFVEYLYSSPTQMLSLESSSVQAVTCTPGNPASGSLFGSAQVDHKRVFFRIDLTVTAEHDEHQTQMGGSFRIRLSDGYDSGVQQLTDGAVHIRIKQREHGHHRERR